MSIRFAVAKSNISYNLFLTQYMAFGKTASFVSKGETDEIFKRRPRA